MSNKDLQINDTIKLVHSVWSNYEITRDNLKNPTREFVLKFYSDCIETLETKTAFAWKITESIPQPQDLDMETILYLKLRKITVLREAQFSLGDLYVFQSHRTNNFVKVLAHYLLFTDNIFEQVLDITNGVNSMREQTSINKKKLAELRELKLKAQAKLGAAKLEVQTQTKIYATVSAEFNKYTTIGKEIEDRRNAKQAQLKKMTADLEEVKQEIHALEEQRNQLKDRMVTEEEYEKLKNKLEVLIEVTNSLNSDIADCTKGILEHNTAVDHVRRCLAKIKLFELPEVFSEIRFYRQEEEEAKLSLAHSLKKEDIKHMKRDIAKTEEKISTLKSNLTELRKQLQQNKKKFQAEESKLEEELRRRMENLNGELGNLNKETEMELAELERLINRFKGQYAKTKEAPQKAFNKAKDFVNMFGVNSKITEMIFVS